MAIVDLLVVAFVLFPGNVVGNTQNKAKSQSYNESRLDKLLDEIIGEIPSTDTNNFFTQILRKGKQKKHFTISPSSFEHATKKSVETVHEGEKDSTEISLALSSPNVYFVNLGSKADRTTDEKQEYKNAKRFNIPQWKATGKAGRAVEVPNYSVSTDDTASTEIRVKRQTNELPTVASFPQNTIESSSAPEKNTREVIAMVPVAIEAPLLSSSSVALLSQGEQVVQPEIIGTSRSDIPLSTVIHQTPSKTTLGNFQTQPSKLLAFDDQESTPLIDKELVQLSSVPLHLFQKQSDSREYEETEKQSSKNALKLDRLSSESSEEDNNRKQTKDDSSRKTIERLESKLADMISKLEIRLLNKTKKHQKMQQVTKNASRTKLLNTLKKRLSAVLKKFNANPGSNQPFTIGEEWKSVLNENQINKIMNTKKIDDRKQSETRGSWSLVASQLLKKINQAIVKFKEQQTVRFIGKTAAMYLSFNENHFFNDYFINDLSGHSNDALVSGRARISQRSYGTCGKALILNSGNIRFTKKYFEDTNAITMAMWVRTNVTGYVKWFVPGGSPDFSTETQYPQVHRNVWTHLCGTFNGSTGVTRIYIDGELKIEKINEEEKSLPADFTPAGIGPEFGDSSLMAVDEVYLLSRALSSREVKALYNDCEFNRMVVHYGFQKVNKTTGIVYDQSGQHNDALLQGDAKILDSGCKKCGSCLDMNSGRKATVTVKTDNFKHKPTKAISIGGWFYLQSTRGVHPLVSVPESLDKWTILDLNIKDGRLEWRGYDKDNHEIFNIATAQSVVPEGVWVHILATFDSVKGHAKLFIDGQQKALVETAKEQLLSEDWNEVKIGSVSGGYVDEFVMYNWELERSEVLYIMKYCPDHPKLVSFTVHVPLK